MTLEKNECLRLPDLADGNCLMIWTPFEMIILKADLDLKEYEEFCNSIFVSADGIDPEYRDLLNMYKYRSLLDY